MNATHPTELASTLFRTLHTARLDVAHAAELTDDVIVHQVPGRDLRN